ncbi:MAG: cell division protein FtsZ [Muribaculaceae bacterium]|nr:cell division protein FtsZ [Muribaculaceae bacterium]
MDTENTNHNFIAEPLDPSETSIIKVIGVGGGGNNAINHMFRQGIERVSFVVCNTDQQALTKSPVPTKVLLGSTGLGAGNKPEGARAAAEESIDKIHDLFDDNTRMVFITAGMGGGTGTGASPVVARVAKEHNVLTIGFVTIPFLFEGEKKILKAEEGAIEMSKYVDALLVINNNRLIEIYPDWDLINAFGKADDTLATAARSISELITCEGYINLDFNDVDTTLRNGGSAVISTGYGEGENRVTQAIQDALNSPLLKNRDIKGAKKLLFNLYFSREAEQTLKTVEAEEFNSFVSTIDDDGVDVIWGMAYDDTLGDKVKITILAAGFNTLDNSVARDTPKPPVPGAASKPSERTAAERLTDLYGADQVAVLQTIKDRARYIILTPEQMDDDTIVEKLERTPAYNRDKRVADEIKASAKTPAPTPAPKPGNTGHQHGGTILDFSKEL